MTPVMDVAELAAALSWPDNDAERAARERPGRLGTLDALAEWVAGVQGSYPAAEFRRPRAVVFAGDHGVARLGVSAQPEGATEAVVARLGSGDAALSRLAELNGVGVRIVDGLQPSPSGLIDREDALSTEEVLAALDLGARTADDEVDAGADLLIAAAIGRGATTAAAVLVSVLTAAEPVRAVGRGSGIDDDAWMRKATVVRDARRRAWPHRSDPVALLGAAGSAEIAALTGFTLAAAVRRTPLLLDGVVVTAAALVAAAIAPRVTRWWRAAQLTPEPAHTLALAKLGLTPILELGSPLGDGTGGLLALPLIRAALRRHVASADV
jgi:nicotinate-nucleotide--dimethylbenzimidazole phosphoribosyltransferase